MKTPEFTIEPFGDRSFLVRFAAEPSAGLTAVLAGLAKAAGRLEGVLDACPGLTTVLVEAGSDHRGAVHSALPELMAEVQPAEGTLHEIAVDYDGEDLDWVCGHLGMEAKAVIDLHSGQVYDVRLLGSPGFVYLSDVPPELAVPRLEEPRQLVAAGSVGIGGRQAGIYGRARPGGWRIIGRAEKVPMVIPGDRIRFVPR
ncbi:MAG TPA: carboxyltransferase domain-containing protein [Actinomycetota bacterium]|nr:carboxyltransferase domain-containing protein [Actinomycetota bacterium]